MKPWLGIAFVVGVALFLAGRYFFQANPHGTALGDREVAARGLAESVARQLPGKKAVVLSNPFAKDKGTARAIVEMEEAGLRGVRSVNNGALVGAVVLPELREAARNNPRAVPIDPMTTTPLSYLVAPEAFDHAAQGRPECEVLLSLIGLPVDLDACVSWKKEGAPFFALLLPDLRMVGSAEAVAGAVKSGKLIALVLRKPGGVSEHATVGKDFKAEFDQRFLLVTKENIDDVLARTPAVLQSP